MKKKPVKKYIKDFVKLTALVLVIQNCAGCSPRSENLYEQAYREIESGHYRIAVDLLEKSSSLEKNNQLKYKYLSEAARIVRFEIQDYERALRQFRKIILEADDEPQRISAQEAITEIYLENLQDFSQALKELQILEPLLKDSKKKEKIKLRIVQALYLTGNYPQALDEINSTQKYIKFQETHFLKLKAEVLLSLKKYKECITTYEELRSKFPGFFAEENLYIATSIVYEENEQFTDALNYLTKNAAQIKDKAYYELRVKRLKERISNKPLSKGIRK